MGDNAVFYALNNILEDPKEDEILKFETTKSLILLGFNFVIIYHIKIFYN